MGLAIDFLLLAEALCKCDKVLEEFRPELNEGELFKRYTLVTERGGQPANTLSLMYEGTTLGIRKFEEAVAAFFHSEGRTDYPSAYVYNTGQWQKFRELLVLCFQLSKCGRFVASDKLLTYGLKSLAVNSFFTGRPPRVRIFDKVLAIYPRSADGENGGAVFQAIANGFIIADRPHLVVVSDKVRTGSARQKRIGDIDCYFGLDLECSIEVKDVVLTKENVDHQIGLFYENVTRHQVFGLVVAKGVAVSELPQRYLDELQFLTEEDIVAIVETWDWEKQNNVLHGMLHYLAHIEQSTVATQRLLKFINENDASHSSLHYLR